MTISRHQAVGAYRRWEPESFDPRAEAAPPLPETATEPSSPLFDGLQLPTAEDIERMHDDARNAGFAEGRAQGHAEGLEAGRNEGYAAGYAEGQARVHEEADRFATLLGDFDRALRLIDSEIADEVVGLAVELARQVLGQALTEHPEAVLHTVRTALQQVPHGHARIRLHPADLDLVRTHLGETLGHAGHRLEEDTTLTRGGCRIDTPSSQVDATLETRWRRVLETVRPAGKGAPESRGQHPTAATAEAGAGE